MKFNYQVNQLVNYLKQGETDQQKMGIELEHFVITRAKWRAVTYQEERGIEYLLSQLSKLNKWKRVEEGDHLIGLNSDAAYITLEPGGQLEISTVPCFSLKEIKQIYDAFLQDITPILEQEDYCLNACGYHLKSKIKQIPFNPKQRYKIMAQYLAKQGKYAHHMMKGTAALQITLDYKSEFDFIKKFQVASLLSPVLASLLDNAPVFEGEIYRQTALRTLIWNNTDPSRTGLVPGCLQSDFDYQKYAEYILTREPILLKTNGSYQKTENKPAWKLFRNKELTGKQINHLLTMVFPDVRAKQFIELRMIDSLPPQLMMAAIAFWKGLIYNQSSLNKAYEFSKQFKTEKVVEARRKIIQWGLKAQLGTESMVSIARRMVNWAKAGLTEQEQGYLIPLEELLATQRTPAYQLKCCLKQGQLSATNYDWILN